MGVVLSFLERKRRLEERQALEEARQKEHDTVREIAQSLMDRSAYQDWIDTHCMLCGRDLHPKMIELNKKLRETDNWDEYEADVIALDEMLQKEGAINHETGCELCGLTGGSQK